MQTRSLVLRWVLAGSALVLAAANLQLLLLH